MRIETETQFNVGDKVWRKNLVTHEVGECTVKSITVTHCVYRKEETDKIIETEIVIYHTDDGPLTNVKGRNDANSAYATKEEAEAAPNYEP